MHTHQPCQRPCLNLQWVAYVTTDSGTIKKLKARTFKSNPHKARYEYTWNVDPVIEFWDKQNDTLFRRVLATKAFTLFKIATMGKDADIRIQEHVCKVFSLGTR